MRADAQRNRERLIEVAHAVFKERGLDAPLDEVARRAGVGPGTLYRHFPTREALHEAIFSSWIEEVFTHVDKALATEGGCREKLLAWFEEYIALLTRNQGAAAKITASLGCQDSPLRTKCQAYADANERVLDAIAAGDALREDVDNLDVCRLLGGVATMADQASLEPEDVRPMLDVIANGVLKS
ncbi:AcrR family transcriptional regulator [Nocardioides luteus]|uniref:TetR family transcriptional regulator n=1 Tax=Nocardioides luteus TaxID=1844 RepID=A0ABQ5SYJ9_9ACTN|nr:TetR/AcrR family transcriptional regulator [Nocardioides luteus]MDR7312401.1 AcrR family transcriptional regulator [Nocardioides luteus]GGR58246.1 TetR family transcriptional regulator [Nocardioides luteus]GLJ68648.1 TetR family transcriptional regulator [Nocardioides luteus]